MADNIVKAYRSLVDIYITRIHQQVIISDGQFIIKLPDVGVAFTRGSCNIVQRHYHRSSANCSD